MSKSEKKFETKGKKKTQKHCPLPKNEFSPLLLKQTRIITWQERILHMVILKYLKGQKVLNFVLLKATEKPSAKDLGRKGRFQTISVMSVYSDKSIEVSVH